MKVAFAGKAGSGKTTAANILVQELGYRRVSLAAPLKSVVSQLWPDLSPEKRRPYLQSVGDGLRAVDPYVFIRYLLRDVGDSTKIAVDDVRYPNEVRSLRKAGFLLIYLDVPDAERLIRMEKRGDVIDARSLQHRSETSLSPTSGDLSVFPNTASIKDLKRRLLRIFAPMDYQHKE